MDVLTYFASAEADISGTLANIYVLKLVEVEQTIKDFLNTPNGKSQREKLLEAAKDILDEQGQDELGTLLLMMETAQKKRNRLVHWVSGYSPEIPDAVLFQDPLDYVRESLDREKFLRDSRAKMEKAMDEGIWPPEPTPDLDTDKYRKKILVYKEVDFREMRAEVSEILQGFHHFNFLAHRRDSKVHKQVAEKLHALPSFISALARRRKRNAKSG